jgi:hypothetical protein
VRDVRIPADRVLFLLETDLPGELQVVLEPELEQSGRVLFARELRLAGVGSELVPAATGNP